MPHYTDFFAKIDALLTREDDTKTPYASKYEARNLLHKFLDEKSAEMDPLIHARVAHRLGKIGKKGENKVFPLTRG